MIRIEFQILRNESNKGNNLSAAGRKYAGSLYMNRIALISIILSIPYCITG